MARARRRSTRKGVQRSPGPSEGPSNPASVVDAVINPAGDEEDTCPACKANSAAEETQAVKESWIECDACRTWFHWRCAGNGESVELINKWYCEPCLKADTTRVISLKPPKRTSARKRTQQDYANLNSGLQSDPHRWMRLLEGKSVPEASFKRMSGSGVSLEWLDSDDSAMREPIIVENAEGLGMKMPNAKLSVRDVAESIGLDTPVEVIDVASQANSPGWTLGKWADYCELDPSQRDKIRNVISLEISGTKLADQVLPPRLVRELDWVEKFWPNKSRGKGQYPKVQLYCLMGVANAYTDWHVDFAGSSVYYHVLRGSKVFYFIRPTPQNLSAYERWSGSELQNQTWLGDMVDQVVKVTLLAGNTMIIPTGWIHAVFTPLDALVFGGNFLHSYNIATQLKVHDIENATRVAKKFRFPYFTKLSWYVGEKYLRDLKNKEEFPPRVLEGIEALAQFLVSEVRIMERGTEHAKKESKEHVPADRVKDPAAMARELRWRTKTARGDLTDDESTKTLGLADDKALSNGHMRNEAGHKRKQSASEEMAIDGTPYNKRNFRPKVWEVVEERPAEPETRAQKARRPESEVECKEGWTEWSDSPPGEADGDVADVTRRSIVVVKVRRTDSGVERHRIERVIEEWTWSNEGTSASTSLTPSKPTLADETATAMEVDVVG